MRVNKQIIGNLTKCYSLTKFSYGGDDHLIVAAEKDDPAYSFSLTGEFHEQLWSEPGGVMSMVQYPGREILLATWKFYSPNNSADARIVYYIRDNGSWKCSTLCELPFVHRFGILQNNNRYYLIACTIKSDHKFKGDWSTPGKIWVSELPLDIENYNIDHPLNMQELKGGLLKNHGFYMSYDEAGNSSALIGCDNGIYKVTPPIVPGGDWNIVQLLDVPTSDMVYEDIDGDGKRELLVFSPFHGDTLSIYKQDDSGFHEVYRYPDALPFLHALTFGDVCGKKYFFIGNREGTKDILAISYSSEKQSFITERIDQDAGAANLFFYKVGDENILAAANRESNEIALYYLNC